MCRRERCWTVRPRWASPWTPRPVRSVMEVVVGLVKAWVEDVETEMMEGVGMGEAGGRERWRRLGMRIRRGTAMKRRRGGKERGERKGKSGNGKRVGKEVRKAEAIV